MAGPNPWDNDPIVSVGGGGGPLPSPPKEIAPSSPLQIRSQEHTEANAAHDNTVTDKKLRVDNPQTLRKEFYGLPEVKAYKVATQELAKALATGEGPQADLALTYAFAKAMDPDSVVRESETASVTSSQAWLDAKAENIKKQFRMDGAGNYTPEARTALRQQIIRSVAGRNKLYNQQRTMFTELAKRNSIDPFEVVGPHNGDAFREQFRTYDDDRREDGATLAPLSGAPKANSPEIVGGLPKGTEIEFGMDKQEGPFDRATYLRENHGLTPDQEAKAIAFWNSNRGNAGLTPEAVKEWYRANGVPLLSDQAITSGIDNARKGYEFTPIDTSAAEKAYRDKLQGNLDAKGFDPTSGTSYAERFVQGAELGMSDEVEGALGGIGALFSNKGVGDGYIEARDTARLAAEQKQDKQGFAGNAIEFAGGVASGLKIPAGSGVVGGARSGAAAGGVAGFGYGEGTAGSVTGAFLGAGGGAAIGAGTGKLGEMYLARKGTPGKVAESALGEAAGDAVPQPSGRAVIEAADRLNEQFGTKIRPTPADVSGPGIRNLTGGAAKLPLAAQPIVKGAEAVGNEAEVARNAIAKLAGAPTELETAGEAALTGAQKWIKTSGARKDRLYKEAERLGGDQPVDLAGARKVLDDQIAELESTPGGAKGLSDLKALRAELNSPYPVAGVKNMRTQLRDRFAGDGLRMTDIERRAGLVADAAEQDIIASLNAAGKGDAAAAYTAAAKAHSERVGVIDTVLAPIIGAKGSAPKSGEDIMAAINSATQRNNARLGKFLASLPPEDAATVRSTLIANLGKASKGTQNAEGTAFSLPQFLTHWNGMTKNAKATLFGPQLRSALDDLAKVAEGTKEAQRFANFSNTGSPVGLLATGASGSGFFAFPITTTVLTAAQYGMGRLLASPSFARWLAKAPAVNPKAMPNYIAKLGTIASENAAIAADARGLQRVLMERFANAPQRAAASEGSSEDRRVPIEQ